jgi:hypothetical protein
MYKSGMKVNVFSHILCGLCVLIPSLSLVCCIRDGRGGCVQYEVSARLVDQAGNTVPDSVARRSSAFLFLNGKYARSISAGSDGCYPLSYNGCDAVSLVVFGDKDIHGFTLSTLTGGVSMDSTAVRLDSLLQPTDTMRQSRLYYGNLDCSRITPEENNSIRIYMYDRLARLHVILSGLTKFYGEGTFSVTLGGLHNTFTYGGTVRDDTVSITPGLYRREDGSFVSGTVAIFPSSSPVRVSIWKDGVLLASTDEDSSAHPITVTEGDDKAIIITSGLDNLNIRVMPWSECVSQNVFL